MALPPLSVGVPAPGSAAPDTPRNVTTSVSTPDRIFRGISATAALVSLVIIGTTAWFLAWSARPAFAKTGFKNFFTTSNWSPSLDKYGVFGLIVGTVLVASVALMIAVPLAIGLALFVNEYSPARLRRPLTSAVDLLAALPSLVFGMWGYFALQTPLEGIAQWFGAHLSAIPIFRIPPGSEVSRSIFIAGTVVGIMVIPVITSVSRDVMSQCPREQCEGALALGGTRSGMIRSVVLPFSRSGVVGAILLGFGRALGETIAIAIIIALQVKANTRVLTSGGGSVAGWIASKFGEAGSIEISALVAAGLALFVLTLFVNLAARSIVRRARSET